jgi:hypothetical protein
MRKEMPESVRSRGSVHPPLLGAAGASRTEPPRRAQCATARASMLVDAIPSATRASRSGAVSAAEEDAVALDAVPDHAAVAVRALRRQAMNRALQTIKSKAAPSAADLERLVVDVAADLTAFQRGARGLPWLPTLRCFLVSHARIRSKRRARSPAWFRKWHPVAPSALLLFEAEWVREEHCHHVAQRGRVGLPRDLACRFWGSRSSADAASARDRRAAAEPRMACAARHSSRAATAAHAQRTLSADAARDVARHPGSRGLVWLAATQAEVAARAARRRAPQAHERAELYPSEQGPRACRSRMIHDLPAARPVPSREVAGRRRRQSPLQLRADPALPRNSDLWLFASLFRRLGLRATDAGDRAQAVGVSAQAASNASLRSASLR